MAGAMTLVGVLGLAPWGQVAVGAPAVPEDDEADAPAERDAEAEAPEPETKAAARVLDRIEAIALGMRTTRYQHSTVVRSREGVYAWDCSGMANWIVRKDARRAYASLRRERPVARTYWRAISDAPVGKARRGWERLGHIEKVRPGDVFAWIRPPHWPKGGNTGHIGFAVGAPTPAPGIDNAYTLRVVDATSLPHQDDTRDRDGEGGFGYGTLLFLTDGHGRAIAYGWFGTRSRGVIPTDIVFGRLH